MHILDDYRSINSVQLKLVAEFTENLKTVTNFFVKQFFFVQV